MATSKKILKKQPKGDTSPIGKSVKRPQVSQKKGTSNYKNIKKVGNKFVVGKKRKVTTTSVAKAKKIDRTKAYFKFRNK